MPKSGLLFHQAGDTSHFVPTIRLLNGAASRISLAAGLALIILPWNSAAAQAVSAQDAAPQQAQSTTSQPSTDTPSDTASDDSGFDVPAPPANAQLPEVETVVPNAEFNDAIPKLAPEDDPELTGSLESIEDFERRIAQQQADAKPEEGQSPPANDPALADGDAVEEIGDAPIQDAELTAPLPPLDAFNVEPVEFAEADNSDDKTVKVPYTVKVNGLASADDEAKTDMAGMFKDLSALEESDDAANTAQVAARLTEDSALIKRILASQGWYGAQTNTRIERSTSDNGLPLTAVIDVTPGKRYSFSDIVIKADPTIPPDLIQKNFALKVGEPIIADRVQGAEAKIAVTLPQEGYPFATVGQRDILLDQDTGDGVYTLPVDIGPRSRFGGIETTGNLAFDAEHVDVLTRFKRGDLYDSREVDDLRKALVATGLFNTVAVSPKRSGETADDGTEYTTILVQQDAGPPRTLAGSAGFGTGQGFRVEGSWTNRNMFPPEGALIFTGVAGTQEQGASATFRRSNAGRRDRTFQMGAEALHSNYDAYEAFTGRLSTLWSYDSSPIWQKKLTYAYGAQLIATNEQDYDFAAGKLRRRTFFIGGLTGQLGIDHSNDLLNPTRGYKLTTLIEPEGSLQGGFTPYVRARIDGSAYYPIGNSIVLAGRVRFGTIQGIDRYDLAPSRRFYAGGGGSVRGYGYQQLGPKDPDNDPIGGRSLNEAAGEVRYRFGNFGVVGFVDAGQVYEESLPQFSDIRFGAGIGGRFYTNFGPLRLDVATPLGRKPGESKISVYVSIGQAF
ncbi:BamA/TamA family outer membrane protein [Altererythrobacter indicus]|uniref:BamA/TamA family outer membrane protein n=1 Tax=Altericroceibacterium indicum TaxID=374177 RepID=A0A845A8M9_9SPHN|nr:BamA/TamA family outer membrane protein [Altericroceibacterium indicum]MXP26590.1 BamA/TamA family outer membrane protein [Altericroceibacterium indicum]